MVACGAFDAETGDAPADRDGGALEAASDAERSDDAGTLPEGGGDGSACVDTTSNPQHCGACGHDCLGGSCAAGKCQPVVLWTAPSPPLEIRLTSTRLVWREATAVRSCAKTGCVGQPTVLAATAPTTVAGLAVDDAVAAWSLGDNTIRSCSTNGSDCDAPQTVGGASQPRGLIVEDAPQRLVVWADSGGSRIARSVGGTIGSTLVANVGTADLMVRVGSRAVFTTVLAGQPSVYAATLDGNNSTVSPLPAAGRALAARGAGTAVVATAVDVRLLSVGASLQASPLTSLGANVRGVALDRPTDGDGLYVTTEGGLVRACKVPSCADVTDVLSGVGAPEAIAVDGEAITFVDTATSRILRVRKPLGY